MVLAPQLEKKNTHKKVLFFFFTATSLIIAHIQLFPVANYNFISLNPDVDANVEQVKGQSIVSSQHAAGFNDEWFCV